MTHLADLGQRGALAEHHRRRGVSQPVRVDRAQASPPPGRSHCLGDADGAQPSVRGLDPDEHRAVQCGGGPAITQIGHHTLADVGGQRKLVTAISFASHRD
jgi:hypothetical protein